MAYLKDIMSTRDKKVGTTVPEEVQAYNDKYSQSGRRVTVEPNTVRNGVNIYYGDSAREAYMQKYPDHKLTKGMLHTLNEEGFANGIYPDGKDKGKGHFSHGVGQSVSYYKDKPYPEVYNIKVKEARSLIPNFDKQSEEVKTMLVDAVYRSSLTNSPKTISLINEGRYKEAAKEFLKHDKYKDKNTSQGIKNRMEANAKAIANMR